MAGPLSEDIGEGREVLTGINPNKIEVTAALEKMPHGADNFRNIPWIGCIRHFLAFIMEGGILEQGPTGEMPTLSSWYIHYSSSSMLSTGVAIWIVHDKSASKCN
jgi:hypothetical protein